MKMRYIITYTPNHREMLEYALNMAVAWHYWNIEPVCELMIKAYKRHHTVINNLEAICDQIHQDVQTLREIDYKGEAFGKYDVLKGICLSEKGETILSHKEVEELENLCEFVMRLIIGQIQYCFDYYCITYFDSLVLYELQGIATSLHVMCWNQAPNAYYGIKYSEESDILFDIYQVLQCARYLTFSDTPKEKLRMTNMTTQPMHVAKEPLMRIKTIE